MKIVLFEDTPAQATGLLAALNQVVGDSGAVLHFSDPGGADGTFENRILQFLTTGTYADATLIVADRDLSKTTGLTGLSESSVRRAADGLGIPECSYHRYDQSAVVPAV